MGTSNYTTRVNSENKNVCLCFWHSAGKLWRRRTVVQAPQGDGRQCPSQMAQWKPCLVKPCYSWQYSTWSECKSEVSGITSVCVQNILTQHEQIFTTLVTWECIPTRLPLRVDLKVCVWPIHVCAPPLIREQGVEKACASGTCHASCRRVPVSRTSAWWMTSCVEIWSPRWTETHTLFCRSPVLFPVQVGPPHTGTHSFYIYLCKVELREISWFADKLI